MPSPFYGTDAVYGLRALLGTSNVSDIDAGFAALRDDVAAKMKGAVPRVSSLPTVGPLGSGALVDGQECYLTAGLNGELWHLRYNASSTSAHKWEFVGGGKLATTGTGGDMTTSSSSYVAMTGAPTLTLPATAGDYLVSLSINFIDLGTNDINNMLAEVALNGTDAGAGTGLTATNAGGGISTREQRLNDLPASGVLSVLVKTANAISTRFTSAILTALPVRVG